MAKFTGYRCDGPKCSTVTEGHEPPPGWIRVSPVIDGRKLGKDVRPEENVFYVCSNTCMARLGRVRAKADAEIAVGDDYGDQDDT